MERLRREKDEKLEDNMIKDVRNLFRLTKENEVIKLIRDISVRNLFVHGEKDYFKLVRVGSFWNNNYIEYKSNGDRNKTFIKDYLTEIKPYLNDIINNLKKSDTWKIQLAIYFIFSKDTDEEHVMHSKSEGGVGGWGVVLLAASGSRAEHWWGSRKLRSFANSIYVPSINSVKITCF